MSFREKYRAGVDVLGCGHVIGHGGHHGGGHHGGGFRGGFRGGRGWGGYWPAYVDVDAYPYEVLEEELVCSKYDAAGNCLEYVPSSLLEEDVLGAFDLAVVRRNLDAIKPVTVDVARAMVKGAKAVLDPARALAKSKGLPGETSIENLELRLAVHQRTLDVLAAAGNKEQVYGGGEDLKSLTVQSFVQANAVEEGAAFLDAAWEQMWSEIRSGIAQKVGGAVKSTVEAATGVPFWVAGLGGLTALGLLGMIVWKVRR